MSTEKFCLKWNDFERNISVAFREIRDDKDFFDVTLACEGEEQLSAHKVILAACSPFFRAILRRNQHQHPLLYLKGVSYSDLQSVLSFMYHGEVNVAQEELNGFLSIAEELKVKGLTQGNDGGSAKRARSPVASKPASYNNPVKRPRPAEQVKLAPQPPEDDDIQEVVPVKTEPAVAAITSYAGGSQEAEEQQLASYEDENYAEYGHSGQYEDQGYEDAGLVDFNQSMDGNKDSEIDEQVASFSRMLTHQCWECTECGKKASQRTDLKKHIEAAHLSLYLPCEICGIVFKTRHHRLSHLRKVHGISSK